ncbi:MAG: carboxypeptidase M32 [Thalassobaculales bacterium]
MSAYAALEVRFRRIGLIGDALGILGWDRATLMPDGAAGTRAEQVAALSVLSHELLTAPEIGDLLAAAEGEALTDWQRANLREMRRDWHHATAVPAELVEALSKACAACEMTWRQARPAADFALLLPRLAEVLHLVREVAAAKAAALGVAPYDALLDQYEPGGRAARIDVLFGELAAALPDLVERALAAARPALPLPGPFPQAAQKALGERLMRAAGFDFTRGRLDVSLHPFCGGATGDVRITTRYDEADFTRALMGVMHETGHALYEMGLPEEWRWQPVGRARGMALHESQSLLVEMQACRSAEFVHHVAPLVREAFAAEGPAFTADNLLRHYRKVERSFIRVDADEVTYPAHVILRYRLERALIAGDLALAELPGAWGEGFQALLGVRPPDDRLGCLQDIHWPDGAFGYFPTYTMGAMAAAQFFQAAVAARPEIPAALAAGDFAPLRGWLADNVHRWASFEDTDAVLARATGQPLAAAPFLAHLEARYAQP